MDKVEYIFKYNNHLKDPDYQAHDGQSCEVMYTWNERGYPESMYPTHHIRFQDGWCIDIYDTELIGEPRPATTTQRRVRRWQPN